MTQRPPYGITTPVWQCTRCVAKEIIHWDHPTCYCGAAHNGIKRRGCPNCGNAPEWSAEFCTYCSFDYRDDKPPPPRRRLRYWC